MKCMIVLLAAAALSSAQVLLPHAPAHGLRTQYHAQDELGQYSFGYSGGPSSRSESSHGGVTQGAFSYVDAHGLVQSRSYVADPHNGFRVAGTDIPVDSNTPLAVAPLAHSVAPVAPVAPLAYSAHAVSPLAYSAHAVSPLAYSGHAVSPLAHISPLAHSVVLARRKRQAVFAAPLGHSYAYSYGAYPYHAAYPYQAAHVTHHVNPYPQDTLEVAAAKINHGVQYNNELVRNTYGRRKRSVYAYSAPLAYAGYGYSAYSAPLVHAPLVHTPVVHNPYPQDTYEVADAKVRHSIQYNAEAARNGHLVHAY